VPGLNSVEVLGGCLKGWLMGRAALPRVHSVCLASWPSFGARAPQDPKQVGAGSPRTPEITVAGELGCAQRKVADLSSGFH
jgi:hypothetical protein